MSIEDTLRDGYQRIFGGEQNLSSTERAISTGLGLVLAAGGVRKGAGLPGAIMGAAGAALVARGMSGHCPLKGQLSGQRGGPSTGLSGLLGSGGHEGREQDHDDQRYSRQGVTSSGGRWHADEHRSRLGGEEPRRSERSPQADWVNSTEG